MYESQLSSSIDLKTISSKKFKQKQEFDAAIKLYNEGNAALDSGNYKHASKQFCNIFVHLGMNGTRTLNNFFPERKDDKEEMAMDALRTMAYIQMAVVYKQQKKWNQVIEKCSIILEDDE